MFVPKSRFSYFIASNYLKLQKKLPKVFLDITIGEKPAGRLTIELFEDKVPKTTENFKHLISEQKYKNKLIDKVIPGSLVQGGKIEGFQSIYGGQFWDESFEISHNQPGIVSMANKGPDTNENAFFITLSPAEWFDHKHVAFGRVTDGLEILAEIEKQGSPDGKTQSKIYISDCGDIKESGERYVHNDHAADDHH